MRAAISPYRSARLRRTGGLAVSLLALLASLAVAPANAQSGNKAPNAKPLGNRHQISVGAAWQEADVILFAESQNGASADISLNDLAVDDSDSTFYFDYRYRFKERWALAAGAYSFSASGGRELGRDLSYNGVDFTAGTRTEASLEADAYIVDLLYNAYESRSLSVWVGGGVHALDLGASISGEVAVDENETGFEVADDSLLAPVPNFRGVAIWSLNQRVALALKTGWLSANVDSYSGDFTYAHLRAIYAINENLGISLGYQYTEIDIVEERERGDLGFDVVLQGPTITLGFSF